jgi:CxxC-x17-CxxC domain-containing protein
MSADSTLTCRDCGQAFTFTSGEQDFYASRGFSEPTRCDDCRASRKAQRDGGSSSYSSYGSSYGGGRGSREMFDVTCSSCGQPAQVPFQPSQDKPVYCSACFEKRRGSADRSGGNRYGGRSRY